MLRSSGQTWDQETSDCAGKGGRHDPGRGKGDFWEEDRSWDLVRITPEPCWDRMEACAVWLGLGASGVYSRECPGIALFTWGVPRIEAAMGPDYLLPQNSLALHSQQQHMKDSLLLPIYLG